MPVLSSKSKIQCQFKNDILLSDFIIRHTHYTENNGECTCLLSFQNPRSNTNEVNIGPSWKDTEANAEQLSKSVHKQIMAVNI